MSNLYSLPSGDLKVKIFNSGFYDCNIFENSDSNNNLHYVESSSLLRTFMKLQKYLYKLKLFLIQFACLSLFG